MYALERPRNVLRYAQIALIAVIAFMHTSDNKMHHFTLFPEVTGRQNGVFGTSLDFGKN